jgi:hypothetical protein
MVFGPVDLAHSEKLPLHQKQLKKTELLGTWPLDVGRSGCGCDTWWHLWMLVGPVAGVTLGDTSGCWSVRLQVWHLVTPLARLQALPRPQNCCRSGPLLRDSLSQTSSDIRFRDRNPALVRTLTTDCWLRNEYSVRLIITHLKQMDT